MPFLHIALSLESPLLQAELSSSYTVILFDMFLQPYDFSAILDMDHTAHHGGECKGSPLACKMASEWHSWENLQNPSLNSGFTGWEWVNGHKTEWRYH